MTDKDNPSVIANRGEAIPVHTFPGSPPQTYRSHVRSSSQPPRAATPEGSSARDKLRSLQAHASGKIRQKLARNEEANAESPRRVQDRMMNMLLQQIIPSDQETDHEAGKQSRKTVQRPNFSIPTMSTNFRRFNARCGIIFVFQIKLEELFSWQRPTQTLSFLAIYTFICIDPHMLAIVPIAMLLYFVMFPSFVARHPPPPSFPPTNLYPLTGPPLAPASTVKPAPELSKDFFRNMRDLQNSMEDMSRLHDFIVTTIGPYTNFSDEKVSTALFITLFTTCLILFLIAPIIPWRLLFLLGGWASIISAHPTVAALIAASPANADAREQQSHSLIVQALDWANESITLDPAPEKREVEIFELQFRPLYYSPSDEWEPVTFAPVPYTPLSPARIAGERPKGCRDFEDVLAPSGWAYADKKWSLDLGAREWVEERLITGVEVEVEGGRWVVDVVEDEGKMKHGEWRRRRWVRVVERLGEEEEEWR
ncbi:Pex24p-domain-containing protein [Microthyrium microscopicum]|uniref:Pex24p-domain-containing protein n=1 Tax=Microthyrium microscopicum TaxID=703497 RepID=A0A6A6UGZ3_9PEZI|nr:Pex24p-domain-containing protein [Microthyrium microscopicum]